MAEPKNPGQLTHKQSKFTEEFFKNGKTFELSVIDDFFATKPNEVEEKKILKNLAKFQGSSIEILDKLSNYIMPWVAVTAVAHCFKYSEPQTMDEQTNFFLHLLELGFFDKEQNLTNFNLNYIDKKGFIALIHKYSRVKNVMNVFLINYFHKFHNLDEEVANLMIDNGLANAVINSPDLGKFVKYGETFLGDEIAIKLIRETKQCTKVLSSLDTYKFFRFDDINNVLLECLKTKKESVAVVRFVETSINKGNNFKIDIQAFVRNLLSIDGTAKSVTRVFETEVFFNSLDFEEKKAIVEKILEYDMNVLYFKEAKEKLKFLGEDFVEFVTKFYEKLDRDIVYKHFKRNGTKEDRQNILDNFDEYRLKAILIGHAQRAESMDLDVDSVKKIKKEMGLDDAYLGRLLRNTESHDFHVVLPSVTRLYEQIANYDKKFKTGKSSYKVSTYKGEMLDKISNDNSFYRHDYGEGSFLLNIFAIKKFSKIAESIEYDEVKKVLDEAKNLEMAKDLAEKLEREGPIHTWENLKKFSDLQEMLKNKAVLEKLREFKEKGMTSHYDFFRKLAFYPNSKVPMQKVFEFMDEPESFLGVDDEHGDQNVNERKKPVNMLYFPHLDLNAFDLRDALVDGTMDKLQFFPPAEVNYKIEEDLGELQILDILKRSLTKGSPDLAENPKLLYFRINQFLKSITTEVNLDVKDLFGIELGSETSGNKQYWRKQVFGKYKKDLLDIIFKKDFKQGEKKYKIRFERKFAEYRVRVQKKSSVEGILTGDDLVNCMPFGSGKNNNYMYNLGCAMLTVEKKMGNGNYRTVSGSVIAKAEDIKLSIPRLIQSARQSERLSEIIPCDISRNEEGVLLKDNIEVAPNFKNPESECALEKVLEDFSFKYLDLVSTSLQINNDRFLVGTGYNDLQMPSFVRVENTYFPYVPYAYSDNYGGESFQVTRTTDMTKLNESVRFVPNPQRKKEVTISNRNVKYLDAVDSLKVSYLEGKIYADNTELLQHIHRLTNEITGSLINNELKNRPNLSLKSVNDNGDLTGYMIAYEGVLNKDSEEKFPVIYISDFAVDKTKDKSAGAKILGEFMHLIEENYFKKGIKIPFKFRAREKTSYQLAKKMVDTLSRKYQIQYKLTVLSEQMEGDDKMYEVEILPIQ